MEISHQTPDKDQHCAECHSANVRITVSKEYQQKKMLWLQILALLLFVIGLVLFIAFSEEDSFLPMFGNNIWGIIFGIAGVACFLRSIRKVKIKTYKYQCRDCGHERQKMTRA